MSAPPRAAIARRAAALFALALLARLVASAASGLYVDEAYCYFMSRLGWSQIVPSARSELHPPLWYFLMHPLAITTRDGLILRLPSSVLGALSAPLTYLAGRTLSERTGLMAGALTAASYVGWMADAQTRCYGLLAALSAFALWATLDEGFNRLPRWRWALLGVASVGMPLLHMVGWLVDVGLLLASMLPGTTDRARRAACFIGGLIAGGGWMGYAASASISALHPRQPHPAQIEEVLLLPASLSGLSLPLHWPMLRPSGAADAISLALSAALTVVVALGLAKTWRACARAAIILALYAGVPLGGIIAGSLLGMQTYQNRYLATISGGLFILLGAAATRLHPSPSAAGPQPPRSPLRGGVSTVATVLWMAAITFNLVTAAIFPYDRYLHNQDWRAAAAWIERRETMADVIVSTIPYSLIGLNFYYHAPAVEVDFSVPQTMQIRLEKGYSGAEQMGVFPAQLSAGLAERLHGRRVFLLLNQVDEATRAEALDLFRTHWRVEDALALDSLAGWGRIFVYELSPTTPDRPR